MSMRLLAVLTLTALTSQITAQETDATTGLIIAQGWDTVQTTCTECHSAQLITQNSGSKAVWQSRITWMQDTQGLRQLNSEEEATILDYLATNYGQKEATRRAALPAAFMPANPYPVNDE